MQCVCTGQWSVRHSPFVYKLWTLDNIQGDKYYRLTLYCIHVYHAHWDLWLSHFFEATIWLSNNFWATTEGEILQCLREMSNQHYLFAVAILKDGSIIGHVPQRISIILWLLFYRPAALTLNSFSYHNVL